MGFNHVVSICILSMLGLLVDLPAQECGTNLKDQSTSYLFQKDFTPSLHKQGSLEEVPVKIHVVSGENGIFALDSSKIWRELAIVNEQFNLIDMHFVPCGNINYIEDNDYIRFKQYEDEGLADEHDVLDVINIYFVPELDDDDGEGTICGYAYNFDVKQRLFMANNCSTNGSTLTHELGHTFSLPHTHATIGGRELVNGSNCSFTGDRLCDTPADPRLSNSIVTNACQYTGTDTDSNGDVYTPDVNNIMSYSRKRCRTSFSPQQLGVMSAFYNEISYIFYCEGVATSTKEEEELDLNLGPVPTHSNLNIQSRQGFTSLRIWSMDGQEIDHEHTHHKQYRIQKDVSQLTSGSYLLIIENETHQAYRKFIKF
jgi:hypothetical protein